jgi:hypothetical protein
MTIRTTRDWRGIKHRLSGYSTPELLSVLSAAQQSRAQMEQFLDQVADELALRDPQPFQESSLQTCGDSSHVTFTRQQPEKTAPLGHSVSHS